MKIKGQVKKQAVGFGMGKCSTTLGVFIRTRRLELKISQERLAALCSMKQNSITRLELGHQVSLKTKQVKNLALALNCDEAQISSLLQDLYQERSQLNKLLRDRMDELGFDSRDLIDLTGMTESQAKNLLARDNRSINYKLYKPLLQALKLKPAQLAKFLGRADKKSKSKLGNLIRLRRKTLGIKAYELAKNLDITRAYMSLIELGKVPLNKNTELREKIAIALKLDPAKLVVVCPKRRLKKKVYTKRTNGKAIYAARMKQKLTQDGLAHASGVNKSMIHVLESDQIKTPNPETLAKLAKTLGIELT